MLNFMLTKEDIPAVEIMRCYSIDTETTEMLSFKMKLKEAQLTH